LVAIFNNGLSNGAIPNLLWRRRKGTSSALISLTIKKLFSLAKKEIVVDQEISLVNEIR
jgi:hypothetical protein